MKTKLLLVALFVALTTMGPDCINDPLIIAVNLDPVTGCWHVNPGDGLFNSTAGPYNVADFIDPSYRDKIEKLRIRDIIVRVTPGFPAGNVSGDGYFGFDTPTANVLLLHFSGPYSSFANGGVSLLNPGGLITYDPAGLATLIAAISNVNNLPRTVVLRGVGGGPPVTPPSFDVCCEIYFQADANAQ